MKKNIFCFLLCFLSIGSLIAQVPSYVPTSGLVGWWPFNGNANDESGNGNHGTVSGPTLTVDRYNQSNKSYLFDGVNDEILIPRLSNIEYKPITYSLWINLSSYDRIDDYPPSGGVVLIGRDSCGYYNQGALMIYNGPNYINKLNYYTGDNNCGTNYTPELNNWIHIVLTIDNLNNYKFYKNSELLNSENKSLSHYNNIMFKIGAGSNSSWCNNSGPRFTYEGKIDDIGIWNRALTQQEVTNLYLSTTPAAPSDCD